MPTKPPIPPELAARSADASRVTVVGSIVNFALTGFKLAAGLLGGSAAMVADAIHSLSDFATDLVVLITMRVTRRPVDEDHDYGHGRFETLATMIIGVTLLVVGGGIGWSGIRTIHGATHGETIPRPHVVALVAAAVSIIAKEWLYRWTVTIGRRLNCSTVIANAWHHRSDALSSVGTLAGIGGAIALGEGWTLLDPIASIVVSFFILRVALQISRGSLNEMLESALPPEDKTRLLDLARSVDGVSDPHRLRTRRVGSTIAAELHVRVAADLSVREGHHLATEVEGRIREAFGPGTLITVHVEPRDQAVVRSTDTI
jgi:cation diffusion facilitator family transporter